MSDDPKAAPSLADRYFAEIVTPHGDISDFDGEVLAALRAVEAVRAFKERHSYKSAVVCKCKLCEGFCDGVEAVQALLEGGR